MRTGLPRKQELRRHLIGRRIRSFISIPDRRAIAPRFQAGCGNGRELRPMREPVARPQKSQGSIESGYLAAAAATSANLSRALAAFRRARASPTTASASRSALRASVRLCSSSSTSLCSICLS
jgi:hypothetical protein